MEVDKEAAKAWNEEYELSVDIATTNVAVYQAQIATTIARIVEDATDEAVSFSNVDILFLEQARSWLETVKQRQIDARMKPFGADPTIAFAEASPLDATAEGFDPTKLTPQARDALKPEVAARMTAQAEGVEVRDPPGAFTGGPTDPPPVRKPLRERLVISPEDGPEPVRRSVDEAS